MATKKTATKSKSAPATKAKKASAKKAVPAKQTTPAKKATSAKKASTKKAEVQASPVAVTSKINPKKLSAIDAAAQVLAETGEGMNTKQMIEAMTAQGLWSSPNGKTPASTLYSSILREINLKGEASRFVKTERGKFVVKA